MGQRIDPFTRTPGVAGNAYIDGGISDDIIVRLIYQTKDGKAADIKKLMNNPGTYSIYRDRLINKHLVNGDTYGYLKIRLPRFEKYINLWGDD